MGDNQRIDDLRRRVQKDPASIAFAQLGEELRRAGDYQEAIDVCRAGLQIHPSYLSARVTLGRALLELNELSDAQAELEFVLKGAPENLAAIRGLGEIHHRRGELPEALAQYRAALALARNDPDLQETVDQLSRQVEPHKPAVADDGLSFDQMQSELMKLAPAPAQVPEPASAAQGPEAPASAPLPWEVALQAPASAPSAPLPWEVVLQPPASAAQIEPAPEQAPEPAPEQLQHAQLDDVGTEFAFSSPELAPTPTVSEDPGRDHAERTVAALEQWLAAIHVARPERSA